MSVSRADAASDTERLWPAGRVKHHARPLAETRRESIPTRFRKGGNLTEEDSMIE